MMMNVIPVMLQYQFMIGDNLLVAPVVSENENFKKLYLPEGKWLNWWDSKVYEGNQWIIVEAPMDEIPLFIREGGIIPMQAKQNFVGEKNISQIRFKIFPNAVSEYNLYQDDGSTTNYKKGVYSLTNIKVNNSSDNIELSLNGDVSKYDLKLKNYLFDIYNVDEVKFVESNGVRLSQLNDSKGIQDSNDGFYFDKKENRLKVKLSYAKNIKLVIH